MNRIAHFLLISFVLCPFLNFAQFGFSYDASIPVIHGADTLLNPWAGGLNYAQFSDFDYDFDGDLDLFIFDRSNDQISVFTQEGTSDKYYNYVYNARLQFPEGLRYRATLIDYDNDGRKDLFTAYLGGIRIYRNVGDQTNGLQWELFQSILYSEFPNVESILGVSIGDIPGIADVDFDGDIDILTFNAGGSRVEYHQNQSIDLYGIPDSMIFELKNECWGKFTENDNNNGIVLNDPNVPCVGGNISNPEGVAGHESKSGLHVGSSMLVLDFDNSGVMDLLIGDASYSSLTLLLNGGTAVNTDSPMTSVEYNFPGSTTTPIKIERFPASFFLDVDFDGVKDLIATPNALNISFNEKSVTFYKNIGTNDNPNFIPASTNFLQSEMIEHGTGSVPILVDLDGDSLKDLVVANFYRYKPILDKESTIAFYKNVGTASSPSYQYIDYDYFNLGSHAYGLRTIPTFGDLDNDGDQDMLLGIADGTLIYRENTSVGAGLTWGAPVNGYPDNTGTPIAAGLSCHPVLFDLNNDGLLDLIIGMKTGLLEYYENVGTLTNPAFELKNTNLGNVNVAETGSDGYAAPHFIRVNDGTRLFVGNLKGSLAYYDEIDGNLTTGSSFQLVSEDYLNIQVGGYSSFFVEDINADGNLNMFVGQDLGGIFHFEADSTSDLGYDELLNYEQAVSIYPNPAASVFTVSSSLFMKKLVVTDINGRIIIERELNAKKELVNVAACSSGVYFVTVELDNNAFVMKKLIRQ
ncbi:MAG: FG-GAP-like repeat-containing protein [Crocinitomicaceae bacterium]